MIRFIVSIYILGVFVCLALFLIFVPNIPLVDAVIYAALWPYGVYRYFIAARGAPS